MFDNEHKILGVRLYTRIEDCPFVQIVCAEPKKSDGRDGIIGVDVSGNPIHGLVDRKRDWIDKENGKNVFELFERNLNQAAEWMNECEEQRIADSHDITKSNFGFDD